MRANKLPPHGRKPAGATVHVPQNVPHGFRNVGKIMGKVLAMYETGD